MQNEKEVDSFLDGLDKVVDDPFKPNTEDPLNTVVPEAKKEEEPEEKLPFNKDPKVLRFIEKEISKRLANAPQQSEEKRFVEEHKTDDSLGDVLTRIIGNDTAEKQNAIKDFKKELSSLKEQARYEALQEIEDRQSEEKKAEVEAQNELVQGFEDIEETFNVDLTSEKAKTLRSDFVDFIKLVAPKDEEGQVAEYPDLQETFKLFQQTRTKSQTPNRAKELASRSMNRPGDAGSAQPITGRSWRDIDRIFSKLSS